MKPFPCERLSFPGSYLKVSEALTLTLWGLQHLAYCLPQTLPAYCLKVKVTQSCPTLWPHGLYSTWNSLGQNTGVGSLSLLQGIFPTQGTQVSPIAGGFFTSWATTEAQEHWCGSLSLLQRIFPTQEPNQGLLHCTWILYQLNYQGSPRNSWWFPDSCNGSFASWAFTFLISSPTILSIALPQPPTDFALVRNHIHYKTSKLSLFWLPCSIYSLSIHTFWFNPSSSLIPEAFQSHNLQSIDSTIFPQPFSPHILTSLHVHLRSHSPSL